jgi:hypothetical protein
MAGRGLLCRNLHHVLDLLGPLRARVRERRAQAAHLPAEAAQDWAEHASCRDLGVARQCCLDALLRDMAPDGDQIAYQYNIFCKTMDCLEQDTSTTRFTHRHPLVQDSSRCCNSPHPALARSLQEAALLAGF